MKTYQDNLFRELIVDNFAGGGGASTGIELATGQPVDIAINHDPEAIKMHKKNHPFTKHYCESVWEIDPIKATDGRKVGLAWFSPDCTHFSKAKGGKPRKKEIRALAWVVIRWAKTVKPKIIMLENVEEFKTWGPLDKNGYPIKEKEGETFNKWLQTLKDLGYQVEMKELRACDYGAPTTRKRLFIIARCDGEPIVWPNPTHGEGLKPYKTALDIIDFNLLGESIFEKKKPPCNNTLRRIMRGIDKFVIKNAKPFIIPIGYGENKNQQPRLHDIESPLPTIVSVNKFAVVIPHIIKHYSGAVGSDIQKSLDTITAVDHNGLVLTFLQKYYGNDAHNSHMINEPVRTIRTIQFYAKIDVYVKKYQDCNFGNWAKIRKLFNHYLDYNLKENEIIILKINNEEYIMTDITIRMLTPRELYAAQGFPQDYNFELNGEITKTEQVKKVGNSVCPQLATALVRANYNVIQVPKLKTMEELHNYMQRR